MTTTRGVVAIAHPGADLYGSDRQLIETVRGLAARHWTVRVYLPDNGPLVPLLTAAGARVETHPFPVLRRSLLSVSGLNRYAREATRAVRDIRAHLAATRPDVVVVNTITIPPWLVAARWAGIPSVCHVHEAEESAPVPVRAVLGMPAALATVVVVNSRASLEALASVVPTVRRRARVVYNGIPGPPEPVPGDPVVDRSAPARLAVVGRLSPRKGTDVALEAVALLVQRGHDVRLDVCGSVFPGYEWFEEHLRRRAAHPDLRGRVTFHGYVDPTWPILAGAAVVLVPSRQEPFGNTAVEALLSSRPVVASNVQGLREIVRDGVDGLLVPADDAAALATAVGRLLDDPALAGRLAAAGAVAAQSRFSPERYARDMTAAVVDAAASRRRA